MRTPASGAIHNFRDKRVVSDIVPPLSVGNFPFSIECKKVECSWELSALLEGTSQTLKEHWEQCVEDANREGLIPLLIFNKNFRDVYAVMKKGDWELTKVSVPSRLEIYFQGKTPLVIFRLKDFLSAVTCKELVATMS